MARRLDHRRDVLQPDLYHQREVQGEATSADTPDGERAHRGRRESITLPQVGQLSVSLSSYAYSRLKLQLQ